MNRLSSIRGSLRRREWQGLQGYRYIGGSFPEQDCPLPSVAKSEGITSSKIDLTDQEKRRARLLSLVEYVSRWSAAGGMLVEISPEPVPCDERLPAARWAGWGRLRS